MSGERIPPKGRGAGFNPPNRFDRVHHEIELETVQDDADYLEGLRRPETEFLEDHSRSIIAENQSPDVGFEASINPYRGCEHGCIYCYARPTHEFLGLSAGLDFETRILVKREAPALLRAALDSPRWRPRVLSMSGVTDPYQPIERKLRLTRACLEVMAEYRQPVTIVTKNRLVARDVDVLADLAKHRAAGVLVSITTLNPAMAAEMEPRTSRPSGRLAAIRTLSEAGVPTGVMVAPVIPGLTDHEMPAILEAAAKAGARIAGYVPVRLPMAVAPLFEDWLERHRPDAKTKVLNRIRSMHGGKLYDARFGDRMRGEGPIADVIARVFKTSCRRLDLNVQPWPVTAEAFQRPAKRDGQLRLFD
ncbi:PA0069 family radical SAM protein [Planctomyces sp. SH-PL62]|uniref:PA0069 family radical SAM protein n=1 Tax=Planctomyces sp. SH-PL62 TaxID=1636152 RepID=UPI00078C64AC|nr:PA0069 family radical SAM protein [Planctomyces sp. SH-PL62]AMV36212.1 Radical SAM superfamily protein [Planctomyces sp. SH-PL62]